MTDENYDCIEKILMEKSDVSVEEEKDEKLEFEGLPISH